MSEENLGFYLLTALAALMAALSVTAIVLGFSRCKRAGRRRPF